MKHLTDMNLFDGEMEEITMMQLRKAPGDIFAQVQMGKKFILTKSGKPIAELSQIEPTAVELGGAVRRLGVAG